MATDGSRDIFPFFKLPAELRDWIYDEALEKQQKVTLGAVIEANDTTATNLLLVNKQFSREYQARGDKHLKLTVSDHNEALLPSNTLELPTRVSSVSVVHLRVSEGGATEFTEHTKWMSTILQQLPNLAELHIDVNMFGEDTEGSRSDLLDSKWEQWKHLKTLRVFTFVYDKDAFKFDAGKKPALVWDGVSGGFVTDDARETGDDNAS